MKKRKKGHLKTTVCSVLAVAIICVFAMIFVLVLNDFMDSRKVVFNDGWNVTYRGKTYLNVDLYKFRFPGGVKRGERIVLDNDLPATIGKDMMLEFKAQLSYVDVYVNQIYSYAYPLNGRRDYFRHPGNAIHVVALSENAAGKHCQITIYPGMDDAFDVLPLFYLIPSSEVATSYMTIDIYTSLTGFFMFMIGVILICLAIVLCIIRGSWQRTLALGALAFSMGVWSLCRSDAIELFSSDYAVNTRIEYVCLFFAVIPFAALVMVIRGTGRNRRQKLLTYTGFSIVVVFFVAAYALEYNTAINTVHMYSVFHLMLLVATLLLTFGTKLEKGQKSSRDYRILNYALLIAVGGFTADIIRYYLRDRVIVENRGLYHSLMPFVSLVFIMIMLFAYLVHLNDHYMQRAAEQVLKKMAYTDVLTGLHNRAWANDKFNDLGDDGKVYTIISLDVNGLKQINDSKGHSAGDALIRDCAKILTSSFQDIGEVIRMGGDEFLVILRDISMKKTQRALKKMKRLEASYTMRRDVDIVMSFGVASSDEKEGMQPESVYQKADSRMYDMKKIVKYGLKS